MSQFDEDTLPIQRAQAPHHIQTSLEFRISSLGGDTNVLPIRKPVIRIGPSGDCDVVLAGGPHLCLGLVGGLVHFQQEDSQCSVTFLGQPVQSGKLEVGDSLAFDQTEIMLWDRSVPMAFLQGCLAPHSGRIWPIRQQVSVVGRRGNEVAQIQLDDPSVSREHARLHLRPHGTVLEVTSKTNPVFVNGEVLQHGSSLEIFGDEMLEFGSTLLRFHDSRSPSKRPLLDVVSQGPLQVQVGGIAVPDSAWVTRPVKWLMARLAHSWGKPVSTEVVQEMLWPDSDPEKGRNRLNSAVSSVRQLLKKASGLEEQSDYVLRSSSTLQLNPDLLGRYDVHQLEQQIQQAQSLRSKGEQEQFLVTAQAALQLYQGRFLEDCDLDWACEIRHNLDSAAVALTNFLLEDCGEQLQPESCLSLARLLLKLEPYSQTAARYQIRSLRLLGQPSEAMKFYERFTKNLRVELDVEPDIALLKEYLASRQ